MRLREDFYRFFLLIEVYVAAAQCGYTVLELSASHKRGQKELSVLLGDACGGARLDGANGKTAVLLDDVDVLTNDDPGFWSALLKIIANAKCPVIVTFTSNLQIVMIDDPFNACNPSMTNYKKWIEMIHVIHVAIPDNVSAYLQLIGCLKGLWFDESVLSQIHTGSIGHQLLQLQMHASGYQVYPGCWVNVSLSVKPHNVEKELDIKHQASLLCYRSMIDIVRTNTCMFDEPENDHSL